MSSPSYKQLRSAKSTATLIINQEGKNFCSKLHSAFCYTLRWQCCQLSICAGNLLPRSRLGASTGKLDFISPVGNAALLKKSQASDKARLIRKP